MSRGNSNFSAPWPSRYRGGAWHVPHAATVASMHATCEEVKQRNLLDARASCQGGLLRKSRWVTSTEVASVLLQHIGIGIVTFSNDCTVITIVIVIVPYPHLWILTNNSTLTWEAFLERFRWDVKKKVLFIFISVIAIATFGNDCIVTVADPEGGAAGMCTRPPIILDWICFFNPILYQTT